jgi:hypothetical protein
MSYSNVCHISMLTMVADPNNSGASLHCLHAICSPEEYDIPTPSKVPGNVPMKLAVPHRAGRSSVLAWCSLIHLVYHYQLQFYGTGFPICQKPVIERSDNSHKPIVAV